MTPERRAALRELTKEDSYWWDQRMGSPVIGTVKAALTEALNEIERLESTLALATLRLGTINLTNEEYDELLRLCGPDGPKAPKWLRDAMNPEPEED